MGPPIGVALYQGLPPGGALRPERLAGLAIGAVVIAWWGGSLLPGARQPVRATGTGASLCAPDELSPGRADAGLPQLLRPGTLCRLLGVPAALGDRARVGNPGVLFIGSQMGA